MSQNGFSATIRLNCKFTNRSVKYSFTNAVAFEMNSEFRCGNNCAEGRVPSVSIGFRSRTVANQTELWAGHSVRPQSGDMTALVYGGPEGSLLLWSSHLV